MHNKIKKLLAVFLALIVLSACSSSYYTNTTSSSRFDSEQSANYDVSTSLSLKTENYLDDTEKMQSIFDKHEVDVISQSERPYSTFKVSYLQTRDLLSTHYDLKVPKEQFQAFKDEIKGFGTLEEQGTTQTEIDPQTTEDIEFEIEWRENEIARIEKELEDIDPRNADDIQVRASLNEQIRLYKEEIRNLQNDEEDHQTSIEKVSVSLTLLEVDPSLNPDQARSGAERLSYQFGGMLKRIGWVIQDTLFLIMMIIPYIIPFILLYYTYKGIRSIWWKVNPYAKQRREYRRARRFAILKKYYNYLGREYDLEEPRDESLIQALRQDKEKRNNGGGFSLFRKKKDIEEPKE